MLFEPIGLPTPPVGALRIREPLIVLEAMERGEAAALVRASLVQEEFRSGRLVNSLGASMPLPRDYGYFVISLADSRKRDRIAALRDWLRGKNVCSLC
jgi:DNA-binding transcriptional LysR family regulator